MLRLKSEDNEKIIQYIGEINIVLVDDSWSAGNTTRKRKRKEV